jgi:hypothetical protein
MSIKFKSAVKMAKVEDSTVANILSDWMDAKSVFQEFRERAIRNLKYYLAVQSTDVIKNKWLRELKEQGIEPKNYNLIQVYVEGHVGNFSNFKTTPKFTSQESELLNILNVMNEIYFIDADNFDYDAAINAAIQNKCLSRACIEMKIVRSPRFPFGRIKLQSLEPVDIIFDPAVKGNNIAKESDIAYKQFLLTPLEILKHFPHKGDEMQHYIRQNAQYTAQNIDSKYEQVETILWNNKVNVLEVYRKYPKKSIKEFDMENGVFLPQTQFEDGSEDDIAMKKLLSAQRGTPISPNVVKVEQSSEELYVTTIIPELSVRLENRPDERQIVDAEGKVRLPFFTDSFVTAGGTSCGVPDFAIDTQDDINLRELTKTKMMAKTPQGKFWYHPLVHGDDPNKKAEIEANLNDPTIPQELSEDAPPGANLFGFIPGTPVNPEVVRDENFKIGLLQNTLRLNAAMQGAVGKSGESALLHSRKVAEGNNMLQSSINSFQTFLREIHKSWLYLAVNLYGGSNELQKTARQDLAFVGKEKTVTINRLVGFDESNNPVIEDEIAKIDPYAVTIQATKKNSYMRGVRREVVAALLQMIPETPQNIGFRALLQKELFDNIEEFSAEDRVYLNQITKLVLEANKNNLIALNAQAEAQVNNIMAQQQQQMMQSVLGQMGQLGQGAPGQQVPPTQQQIIP